MHDRTRPFEPRRLALALLAGLAAILPLSAYSAPPVGAQGGPNPAAPSVPQDSADAQFVRMIQQLQQINPFVQHSPAPATGAAAGAATGVGATPGDEATASFDSEFAALKGVLQNKWVQKYLHVLSDPALQQDSLVLLNHPERNSFFLWELGWVVFMLVFKAWRMMKAKGFWRLIYTQLWTLGIFLAGVLYFIPHWVLGPDYLQFVRDLIRAMHG